MKYHHLTLCQRSQIYALKSNGLSFRKIAEQLSVSPSTVLREVKRNAGLKGYRYKQAHEKATLRRSQASRRLIKWTPELEIQVTMLLITQQWSPEQIAGRLKQEKRFFISAERIYQYIHANKAEGGGLYKHLRHQGKRYNKKRGKEAGRGCIPARVDIKERPKVVNRKKRLGDWEGDTMIGAKHKGALVTLVDRKSKYTLIAHVIKKQASLVTEAIKACFNRNPAPRRTITFDNGKEFAQHKQITAELGADCYFARPYASWERGLNEHTNGLIRQYLPKGTCFSKIDLAYLQMIEDKLNSRPRKILGYRTPKEVLENSGYFSSVALGG